MKLLEVLPEVAKVSQMRFASNFQEILLNSSKDIDNELFIVHELLDRPYVAITADIKVVISIVSHLGKDCQVIKIDKDGSVESLFN